MFIGIFGDVHLTKNMRNLQTEWDVTATKSIYYMYDKFDELNVESAVCLGDFFDTPRIEAKHMQLVLPILKHINERTYPTYLLLGNHEIDSDQSNILDFLTSYENIIPVTSLTRVENMILVPYNVDPTELEYPPECVVFTHHDIYGSELAGGKTKAFFGIDPDIFSSAKLVMNGHVHLKSKVRNNVINAGSLLVSSQGELRLGEYPEYYLLNTSDGELLSFPNKHSLIYVTSDEINIDKIESSGYDKSHLVLRLEYTGDVPDISLGNLHTNYRKLVENIESSGEGSFNSSNFDLKNYLSNYIKSDSEVPEGLKDDYIITGLRFLS